MRLKKEFKKKLLSAILITVVIIITLTGAIMQFIQTKEEADVLVFYHGWTSSGEQAALSALINLFSEKFHDTIVVPTPVRGSTSGGGVALFNIVSPMIFAGEAPDAVQMHAGYETKTFVDEELLESLDEIWKSEGLTKVVPRVVQAMCRFKDHYYSIPINIHRTNVIWYNKEILDKNNINPVELTTWSKFFEAVDKIKESGIKYPIQMGTTWTAQHTFDQIIASIGIDFYEDWVNGKVTSADDPRLIKALNIFKKYLSYVNPDNELTDWDKATARIISGEGAFNIMGDWANGEFKVADKKYNTDYGSFTVPGTSDMYGIVIDSFQQPKNIQHPKNSERWLRLVASKEGQDTFNPLKGSISSRIDTNITRYDKYQQSAILDFLVIDYIFPAVSNGLPKDFEEKEQEVIGQFVKDLDIEKAAKEITSYAKLTSYQYTITWELDSN